MVSLSKLMTINDQEATFVSPYDNKTTMKLPPEESIRIQHVLGSNIVMQLDDVNKHRPHLCQANHEPFQVISSTANDHARYKEAVDR